MNLPGGETCRWTRPRMARAWTRGCAPRRRVSSRPAICCGGAQAADLVALEGRQVGQQIARFLKGNIWPTGRVVVESGRDVAWVSPSAVSDPHELPALGTFVFQTRVFCRRGEVSVFQGEQLLHRRLYHNLVPNLARRLDGEWLKQVDLHGPALRLTIH